MQITIQKLEKSEIEITGTIPLIEFESYEAKALTVIGDRLELPGFRKGKAPANIVREHATEMMILEEMAEQALQQAYPKIIEENKIDAIGRPEIAITKIAKGSDLEFKIRTAVLPQMDLPDYATLSKDIIKKNPVANIVVDEADVEKTILDLRKMRAHQNMPAHEHEDNTEHDHAELTEEQLPVFDDVFAKSFGDFENTEALKEKIRQNLKKEKETAEKDKIRLMIVEELIAKTNGDIPEILIQSEIDKILYRLESDISNMGFKFDEYLAQIKKTEQELRTEWRADAEKRAKLQMVVHRISEKENLKPSEEEIEKEVTNILETYKDADPLRARAYIENILVNEKVFKFLETQ